MACVAPDGTLTAQAKTVLGAMEELTSPEDLATLLGLPLFRIRASVRELAQTGLVEEQEGRYRLTAVGREKLVIPA